MVKSIEQEDSPPLSPRTASLQVRMDNQIQAITRQMERMFERQRVEFRTELNERVDSIERPFITRNNSQQGSGYESETERPRRGGGPRRFGEHRGRQNDRDDRIEGVKIKIPTFHGRNDPEAYLEWEMKLEQVFACHNYSEEKKVKIASLEFVDYALIWWDQLQKERRRYEEDPIVTWREMKAIMRKRFISSHFKEAESTYRKSSNKVPSTHTSKSRTRDIYCYMCTGRGHTISQCPNWMIEVCEIKKEFQRELKIKRDKERKDLREKESVKIKVFNFEEGEKEEPESHTKVEKRKEREVNTKECEAKEKEAKENERIEYVPSKEAYKETNALEEVCPKEAPHGLLTCMAPQIHEYSTPIFDNMLDKMHGSCYFSTLSRFDYLLNELHDYCHISKFYFQSGYHDMRVGSLYANFDKKSSCTNHVSLLGFNVSFQELHVDLFDRLSSAFILALPILTKSFQIECDASNVIMGAVLLQNGPPIVYLGETYNGSKLEFSTYEINLMHSKRDERLSYVIMPKYREVNMVVIANSQRYNFSTHLELQFLDFTNLKVLYEHAENFHKIYATCDEFFKFVFDPGGLGVCT